MRTLGGVSNGSFGIPKRGLLNRTFLAMLVAGGMEAFLINVRDQALMATLRAAAVLVGQYSWCRHYLRRNGREGDLGARSVKTRNYLWAHGEGRLALGAHPALEGEGLTFER